MSGNLDEWFSRAGTATRGRRGVVAMVAGMPLLGSLTAGLASTGDTAEAGKSRKKKKKCAKEGGKAKKGKRCCNGLVKGDGGVCAPPACTATSCGENQICDGGVCHDCDVTCDFASCQGKVNQAVDAAADGATIYICPGRYVSTSTQKISIDKNLTIVGAGKGNDTQTNTVLDGAQAVPGFISIESAATLHKVTLRNLKLVGADGGDAGGAIKNSGNVTLQNVLITGFGASTGGGIANRGESTLTLGDGAEISVNSASFGGGIYNEAGMVTLLAGSRVTGNTATQEGPDILNRGTVDDQGGEVGVCTDVPGDGTGCPA